MGTHCLALGQMRSQECVKAMKWMVGLPVWLSGKCEGNRDGSGILPSSLQALAGGYGQDDVGGGILLPHPEGVGVSVVGAGGFIRVWVLVMGTGSSLSLGFASFGVFVVVGIPVVVRVLVVVGIGGRIVVVRLGGWGHAAEGRGTVRLAVAG